MTDEDIDKAIVQDASKNVYFRQSPEKFIELASVVKKCKRGYGRSLACQHRDLVQWMDAVTHGKLSDELYTMSTKCCWVLRGIEDFPRCKHCGKPLEKKNVKLLEGYSDYCSASCEVRSSGSLRASVAKRWEKFHQQMPSFLEKSCERAEYKKLVMHMLSLMPMQHQVAWLVESRPGSHMMMLKSKCFKHLADFIFESTHFLDGHNASMNARVFCTAHGVTSLDDQRLRCKTCGKLLLDRSCSSIHGFQHHCSAACTANDKALLETKRQTHFERYGCTGTAPETKMKVIQTNMKTFGTPSWNTRVYEHGTLTGEQLARRQMSWAKFVDALSARLGPGSYGESKRCDAHPSTAFTFNTYSYGAKRQLCRVSKDEDTCFFMLLLLFPHVIRQHKSEQYPYRCDFYDPGSDTYIEFNGSWAHGKHFYDPESPEDVKTALEWKSSAHTTYQSAYETWTVRDVKKRECAEKNGLNYIVFWNVNEVRQYVLDKLQQKTSLSVNKTVT